MFSDRASSVFQKIVVSPTNPFEQLSMSFFHLVTNGSWTHNLETIGEILSKYQKVDASNPHLIIENASRLFVELYTATSMNADVSQSVLTAMLKDVVVSDEIRFQFVSSKEVVIDDSLHVHLSLRNTDTDMRYGPVFCVIS